MQPLDMMRKNQNIYAMKILAVRIGEKYGPEYETYLEKKLPNHEFIWVKRTI